MNNELIPTGWQLTEDEEHKQRVLTAIQRANGHCPCVPYQEDNEDDVCPCLEFRSGYGCTCGLYEEIR